MPRIFLQIGVLLALTSLIPLAMIYRARYATTELPRFHLVWHLDNQGRFKAQQHNPHYEDGRAMRPQVEGTVARVPEGLPALDDVAFWQGLEVEGVEASAENPDNFVDTIPTTAYPEGAMTPSFQRRGQRQYDIYCAVCHARTGSGNGMINQRAVDLTASGVEGMSWTPAATLYAQNIIDQTDGQIFNTISHGKFVEDATTGARAYSMPGYASQLSARDRWAIVAHVRALQDAASRPLTTLDTEEQRELAELRRRIEAEEQEAEELRLRRLRAAQERAERLSGGQDENK